MASEIKEDRKAEIKASRQRERGRKEGRGMREERSTLSRIKGEGFLKFLHRKEAP